ncbi:CRISPR-associated protein Csx16 [Rehaibacterium terrae]|jgi:CRISPR-associated protein Csx16|uniref:CRISPR-associated protein Csx16 n=1 Tax=Rehaibacterium terrae TaxID=1341696 RepID=A0A7W7Y0L4_9GAMM|nr:CRISPR-associated protein Csx16 [Rehaibacterium terrae]MBB5015891.1 CRISPR-associated protein Csx16 [Rehaibacterium terrae]
MNRWLVSRHPGAIAWLRSRGIQANEVRHLDHEQVMPGDEVFGTLPLHVAAAVCSRGARVFCLTMDLPAELRGQELDLQTMERLNVRLEEFHIARLGEPASPPPR